ncbi:MAG: hypothetical protein H6Q20_2169 [Bacteroidetes bacterium]|nr:hypothetical protein [Bacteroidota bacterium]
MYVSNNKLRVCTQSTKTEYVNRELKEGYKNIRQIQRTGCEFTNIMQGVKPTKEEPIIFQPFINLIYNQEYRIMCGAKLKAIH